MKILFTANHGNIANPKEGGDVRRYHLISQLIENSEDSEFIFLESSRFKKDFENSKSFKNPNIQLLFYKEIMFLGYPLSPFMDFNVFFIMNMLKLLRKENIDCVFVSFPMGIACVWFLNRILGKNIKIVYDSHNVESELAEMSQIVPKFIKLYAFIYKPFMVKYTAFIEYLAVKFSDLILAVSREDKKMFVEKYGAISDKIAIVPTGTEIRHKQKTNDSINIIFHGSYNYLPNKIAIDLILNYISKRFYNDKNVMFYIAGGGVPKENYGNVKLLGFVEDIGEFLSMGDIAILPDCAGRTTGSRVKLLEYLGAGLPIVATKEGITGVDIKEGFHAMVVDRVDENFIKSLELLIYNPALRRKMAINSQNLACRKYDWNVIGKLLHNRVKKSLP